MELKPTKLEGCYIIQPKVFQDKRGYFFESFNQKKFEELTGQKPVFVQDNQSCSTYGVLRGLHLQRGEHAQAKLVRVLSGEVLDVAVDVREDSPTFGQHIAIRLSAENKTQLYVPRGFAHGFIVLSQEAEFFYKTDNYYAPHAEAGLCYDDKELAIDWQVAAKDIILSEKDRVLPGLRDFEKQMKA